MTMIDTPEGINFAKACARKGALAMEISGLGRRGRTAYSIVKQVYGFRGSRQSVLEDLSEYIEAELRLRDLTDEQAALVSTVTQDTIDHFGADLDQLKFEQMIEEGERRGAISNGVRQGASDLFYTMIVRQNAGNS